MTTSQHRQRSLKVCSNTRSDHDATRNTARHCVTSSGLLRTCVLFLQHVQRTPGRCATRWCCVVSSRPHFYQDSNVPCVLLVSCVRVDVVPPPPAHKALLVNTARTAPLPCFSASYQQQPPFALQSIARHRQLGTGVVSGQSIRDAALSRGEANQGVYSEETLDRCLIASGTAGRGYRSCRMLRTLFACCCCLRLGVLVLAPAAEKHEKHEKHRQLQQRPSGLQG